MPDPNKSLGLVLHNTYRLDRVIGTGGMGAVYLASHARLKRRFAVKLLFEEVAAYPESLARFRREAEICSELGHPNIVEVIDFNFTEDGAPYIVMELLEGEDLGARLKRDERPEPHWIAGIVEQAASALVAAHTQGVIHRDLKPQNIFIAVKGNRQDVVKIVDFGISKVLGSASVMTRTTATMGTPWYMAPEQAEGRAQEADPRTDIYAMGTIVYEMLYGRPPFTGDSIPTVLYKIVHESPDLTATSVPGLMSCAVAKALAKKPEDRFQTIDAFAAAISEGAKPSAAAAVVPVMRSSGMSSPAAAAAPVSISTLSASAGQLIGEDELPQSSVGRFVTVAGIVGVLLVGGLWGVFGGSTASNTAPPELLAQGSPTPLVRKDGAVSMADTGIDLSVRRVVRRRVGRPRATANRSRKGQQRGTSLAKTPAKTRSRSRGEPSATATDQQKPGTLKVYSLDDGQPLWGDLFIDGKPICKTNCDAQVSAGERRLRLQRAGYPTLFRTVFVKPGSVTRVVFKWDDG